MCLLWGRKKKLIDESLVENIKKQIGLSDKSFKTQEVNTNELVDIPPNDIDELDFNDENIDEICYDDYVPQDVVLDEKDFDIPDDPLPKGELSDLSKRRVWGELALKLRELGFMTLHSACTEVKDLTLIDGVLTAGVKDEFTLKILTEKDNFDKISLALKQIDDRISLQFVLKSASNNKILQNIKILRDLFGDDLTVN